VPSAVPEPEYLHPKPPHATRRRTQEPLGKYAIFRGVLACSDDLKSGRPTRFLDASEAFRVYHCAGTVNSDGRLEVSPWRLGGLSPTVLARRVYGRLAQHDVFDRAASLSYYFLFALFPTVLFLTALLGLLPVPELMDRLLDYVTRMLPSDAASLLARTLAEVVKGARGSLVSIGVV